MENRPKIDIELSLPDRIAEAVCVITLIFLWVFTLTNLPHMPDSIPVHFNSEGEADGYGGKFSILFLPILSTILYAGMTILNRYPHIFNYTVKISPENAGFQYTIATRLIRYLKTIIVVMFSFIVYKTVKTATGQAEGLGIGFLPVFLVLIFTLIIYYLIRASKQGSGSEGKVSFK
jgi:uncharacterized membrane protein